MSDSVKKKGWKDRKAKCSQIIAISGSSGSSDSSEMKLRVSSNSQFGKSSSCSNFSENSLSSLKLEDIATPSSFNSSAELGFFVSCDSSSVPSENDSCIKNPQKNSLHSPNSTIAYCQNVYREATHIVESFKRNLNMTLNDPEKSINSTNDSFKWKTPGHCFKKLYDSASKKSNSFTADTSATFLDPNKVLEGSETDDNNTSPISRFSILDLENMNDNLIGTPSSKSFLDDTSFLNETIFYRENADSREIGLDFLNSSSSTSGNMSAIFKEAHKVLDALEDEASPPSNRLTILDLNKLDDSLMCTPRSKTPCKPFFQERFNSPGASSPKITQMLIRDIAAIAARCNVDFNLSHISELIQQDSKTNKKIQSCEPDARSNGAFNAGVSKSSDAEIERKSNPYLNGTFDTEEKISDCLKEKKPNSYLNGTFELGIKKSNFQKDSNDTFIDNQRNLKCQEENQGNEPMDGTFVAKTGTIIERKHNPCLNGTFDAVEKTSDCQKEKNPSGHLNGTFQKDSNDTFNAPQKNLKCQIENQETHPMDSTFVAKTDTNFEKENINPCVPHDDILNKGIHQLNKEGTFVLDQASPSSSPIPRRAKAGPLNETFEKDKNVAAAGFNSTFDAQTQADIEEDLNRTFEVVGNGSFIIEGKCTNLMDMESNDLKTVLYSTPLKNEDKNSFLSTPVTYKKETDHPKNTLKTSLLKRLSQSDFHPQSLFVKDKVSTHTNGEDKSVETAINLDKFEAFENKAQTRLRLRKTNSGSSCSGPMKAMPLPIPLDTQCLPRRTGVQQRLTSTPVLSKNKMAIVAENSCNSNTQIGAKEIKFPSFGSVSSIETEGPISMDGSSHCLSTPEVFRPTEKRTGPRNTSTPVMSQVNFGYSSFETAPTPIVSSSSKSEVRRIRKLNSTSQEVLDGKQHHSQDSIKIEAENRALFNQPINGISSPANESIGNENTIPNMPEVNVTAICNQPNQEVVPANETNSLAVTETKGVPKSILPDSAKKEQSVPISSPRPRSINSGAKATGAKLGSNLRSVATRRGTLTTLPAKPLNKLENPRSNSSTKVNIGKKIIENKTSSRAKNAIITKPRQPLTVKPSNQNLKLNTLKKGVGSGKARESLMPPVTSKAFKSRLSVNKEVLSAKPNVNPQKITPSDKENAIPQLKRPKKSTIPVPSGGSKSQKTLIPVPRKIT